MTGNFYCDCKNRYIFRLVCVCINKKSNHGFNDRFIDEYFFCDVVIIALCYFF